MPNETTPTAIIMKVKCYLEVVNGVFMSYGVYYSVVVKKRLIQREKLKNDLCCLISACKRYNTYFSSKSYFLVIVKWQIHFFAWRRT